MFRRLPLPNFNYQTRLRLLLLPYASGIVVLVLIPAIISFGLAFFHYDGLSPPRWAGNLNFILAYTDEIPSELVIVKRCKRIVPNQGQGALGLSDPANCQHGCCNHYGKAGVVDFVGA